MKSYMLLPLLSLLLISLANCEKEPDELLPSPDQLVYFQYEYTNYAWGYSHYGWLIDSAGIVHSFSLPQSWNSIDSSGMLSKAAMDSNLITTDSIGQIQQDVLSQKLSFISKAKEGELSEPENIMADAGITVYSAFIYNTEKEVYERVLLKQSGDFTITNNAPEAKILYEWLLYVHQQIYNSMRQ